MKECGNISRQNGRNSNPAGGGERKPARAHLDIVASERVVMMLLLGVLVLFVWVACEHGAVQKVEQPVALLLQWTHKACS